METIDGKSTENNEKYVTQTQDDPKINYRGWKVMPFIIGKEWKKSSLFLSLMCVFFQSS